MNDGPPRVIFDCNILFQAFLTPNGPAYACLQLIEDKRAKLLLSLDLLAEARDVLNRPFVCEKFPHVTAEAIDRFLSSVTYTAELWRSVPPVQTYGRDANDEPYLNLAIAAKADYVVTRDNDLLALATDHAIKAKQFRQLTRNRLKILTPVAFLADIAHLDRPA